MISNSHCRFGRDINVHWWDLEKENEETQKEVCCGASQEGWTRRKKQPSQWESGEETKTWYFNAKVHELRARKSWLHQKQPSYPKACFRTIRCSGRNRNNITYIVLQFYKRYIQYIYNISCSLTMSHMTPGKSSLLIFPDINKQLRKCDLINHSKGRIQSWQPVKCLFGEKEWSNISS